jgi:catechol 2,3-dioxygenase-like lactoylglutathione lyase family enzyme
MVTKLAGGLRGADHIAYPTWKVAETVHFYRDVLGFPLQHCILAPGWGKVPHPDFAHFFFDIGAGGRIAFFYYFGVEPYEDVHVPERVRLSRHTALLVDTVEELDAYQRRIESHGVQLRFRVMHELIESIYVTDPNGYSIEISRPLRELTETDAVDADLTIQALIDVTEGEAPSLAKVWERKAELIGERLGDGGGQLDA